MWQFYDEILFTATIFIKTMMSTKCINNFLVVALSLFARNFWKCCDNSTQMFHSRWWKFIAAQNYSRSDNSLDTLIESCFSIRISLNYNLTWRHKIFMAFLGVFFLDFLKFSARGRESNGNKKFLLTIFYDYKKNYRKFSQESFLNPWLRAWLHGNFLVTVSRENAIPFNFYLHPFIHSISLSFQIRHKKFACNRIKVDRDIGAFCEK